jgi:hypothetical protein
MSAFVPLFGDTLLTKNGVLPTVEVLNGKSKVGIYFSAHWVNFLNLRDELTYIFSSFY